MLREVVVGGTPVAIQADSERAELLLDSCIKIVIALVQQANASKRSVQRRSRCVPGISNMRSQIAWRCPNKAGPGLGPCARSQPSQPLDASARVESEARQQLPFVLRINRNGNSRRVRSSAC